MMRVIGVLLLAIVAVALAVPTDTNGYMEVSNTDITVDNSGVVVEDVQRYGSLYMASHEFASVADSDSVEVVVAAPAAGVDLGFAVFADKATVVRLIEDFAYSDAGTGLTEYDMDRSTGGTASTAISHTPTDTDAGTAIFAQDIAASTYWDSNLLGSGMPFLVDTCAADSIDYCIEIENDGSGDMAGTVMVFWKE
jgi:hypothetical protein